jgi:hypothetical protein
VGAAPCEFRVSQEQSSRISRPRGGNSGILSLILSERDANSADEQTRHLKKSGSRYIIKTYEIVRNPLPLERLPESLDESSQEATTKVKNVVEITLTPSPAHCENQDTMKNTRGVFHRGP